MYSALCAKQTFMKGKSWRGSAARISPERTTGSSIFFSTAKLPQLIFPPGDFYHSSVRSRCMGLNEGNLFTGLINLLSVIFLRNKIWHIFSVSVKHFFDVNHQKDNQNLGECFEHLTDHCWNMDVSSAVRTMMPNVSIKHFYTKYLLHTDETSEASIFTVETLHLIC